MDKTLKIVLSILILAFMLSGIPSLTIWYFDLAKALNLPHSIIRFWVNVSMYLYIFLMIASVVFNFIPLKLTYDEQDQI